MCVGSTLAMLVLALVLAQCPRECRNSTACAPPTCGAACCRYWARTNSIPVQDEASRPPSRGDPRRNVNCATRVFGGLDPVFLHTLTSSMAVPLLPHFFGYYKSLGVQLRTNAHVVVHLHNETGQRTDHTRIRSVLSEHGIGASHIVYFSGAYTPALRDKHVNRYLQSLPDNAWLINSDTDEHYAYPCSIWGALNSPHAPHAYCGRMRDRIAEDFSLQVPSAEDPLAVQFSQCANVRGTIDSGKLIKLTLLRARIGGRAPQFVNAHTAVVTFENGSQLALGHDGSQQVDSVRNCERTGSFSHYADRRTGASRPPQDGPV